MATRGDPPDDTPMASPLIGVGIPVWRASGFIARTLQSVLDQTHAHLRVFISIDGADRESERACRPFASDPRVRVVVQPRRLGWVGNTAAVLAGASADAEFVCVQPHDDWIDADYLAALLDVAEHEPRAAVVFTDLAAFGAINGCLSQDSVIGRPIERQATILRAHFNAIAYRGLTRTAALRALPSISGNPHGDFGCDTVWMARLARAGDLVRVPGARYHKWYGADTAHATWRGWSLPEQLAAWRWHCLDMLAEALTVARGARERRRLARAARDRLLLTHVELGPYARQIGKLAPGDRRALEADFEALAAARPGIGPIRLSPGDVVRRTAGRVLGRWPRPRRA